MRLLRLACLGLACLTLARSSLAAPACPGGGIKGGTKALRDLDKALKALADAKLWAGIAHASVGGKAVLSEGYGQAVPEHGVPMRADHRYAIGSNTKLFTAVSLWQLHEKGLLNMTHTIDVHFNDSKEVFGLAEPWCPRLVNVTDGPCQWPRITDLLSMQSGFIDSGNCDYEKGSWQIDYCYTQSKGPSIPLVESNLLGVGAATTVKILSMWKFLTFPMQDPPGTAYTYCNENFYLAAYILEKVSGMSVQAYFQKHIFDPVGMKRTYYDLSNSNDGLHSGLLRPPGYKSYISPLALTAPALDFDVAGDMTLTEGDIGGPAFSRPNSLPYGRVVKLAYAGYINSAFQVFGFNWGNAAGAIVSTAQDLDRWFTALTRNSQKVLGLSPATVKLIFTTGIARPKGIFAQGTSAFPLPNVSLPLGTKYLFYDGNLAGYDAVTYSDLDASSPAKDVRVSALTYTQPFLDLLHFSVVPHTGPAPPKHGNSLMDTTNAKGTCMMSIRNTTGLGFATTEPSPAAYGLPARSGAALAAFIEAGIAPALARGGQAPAPMVLCDATGPGVGSVASYVTNLIVTAVTGKPWFHLVQ